MAGLFLFQSCAIHAKFPFICFYPACVKGQLGIDRLPGLKKQFKAGLNKRKRKATARNNRNDKLRDSNRKTRYSSPRSDANTSEKDTVIAKKDSVYSFRGESKGHIIRLVFKRAGKTSDSLSYFYTEDLNDISADDKNNLSNYLKISVPPAIEKIIIKDLLAPSEKGRHEKSILKYRAKNLIAFLRRQGIEETTILIE